jgi:hypothetical protein
MNKIFKNYFIIHQVVSDNDVDDNFSIILYLFSHRVYSKTI